MNNKFICALIGNQIIKKCRHSPESNNICWNSPTYVSHNFKYLIHQGGNAL